MQSMKVGDTITWTQKTRRGNRTMSGPILKIEPSGWISARSTQNNMIWAVPPR